MAPSLHLPVKQGLETPSFGLFVLFFRPFFPHKAGLINTHMLRMNAREGQDLNLLSNHESYGRSSNITVQMMLC